MRMLPRIFISRKLLFNMKDAFMKWWNFVLLLWPHTKKNDRLPIGALLVKAVRNCMFCLKNYYLALKLFDVTAQNRCFIKHDFTAMGSQWKTCSNCLNTKIVLHYSIMTLSFFKKLNGFIFNTEHFLFIQLFLLIVNIQSSTRPNDHSTM